MYPAEKDTWIAQFIYQKQNSKHQENTTVNWNNIYYLSITKIFLVNYSSKILLKENKYFLCSLLTLLERQTDRQREREMRQLCQLFQILNDNVFKKTTVKH
jgi:hypothetical protein